jgi:hypothetical protein
MTKSAESNTGKAESTSSKTPKTGGEKPSTARPSDDEIGGPKGAEPTRFGDWEQKGRCSDF